MGLTYVRIQISKEWESSRKVARVLVDTGALYTILPRTLLTGLGIVPRETVAIRLGDGRTVPRNLGVAYVRHGARTTPTWVLSGEAEDIAVLGAVTLEELRLQVDPHSRRLREIKVALQVPLAQA